MPDEGPALEHPAPKPGRDWGPLVFRLGAVSNWLVTAGAIAMPALAADWILEQGDMKYHYLLRIWAGMAFLWGIFFWQIASDLDGYKRVIWFSWAEKIITTVAVTIATFAVEEIASLRCFAMILFTDVLWIPLFFYFDLRTRGNPQPATALARARQSLGLDPA